MKVAISMTIPKELLDKLDELSEKTMVKRSTLITKAIEEYFKNINQKED